MQKIINIIVVFPDNYSNLLKETQEEIIRRGLKDINLVFENLEYTEFLETNNDRIVDLVMFSPRMLMVNEVKPIEEKLSKIKPKWTTLFPTTSFPAHMIAKKMGIGYLPGTEEDFFIALQGEILGTIPNDHYRLNEELLKQNLSSQEKVAMPKMDNNPDILDTQLSIGNDFSRESTFRKYVIIGIVGVIFVFAILGFLANLIWPF